MLKKLTGAMVLAAAIAVPGAAYAQQGTVSGAAGGAVTGAIIGGPVGAAVGGVAGAVLGTAIDPPPAEVRQVVIEEEPHPSVYLEGKVAVGARLPANVELYPVEGYTTYTYTIVNDERVIVDPETRVIVDVVG